MDMDHLIGQRFNLISKSEIRYVGTLHEINPEQSTIALENVFSFGTEDRQAEKFVPPSQQKYGFIIFRGSDVKDIKIAEEDKPQPSPPPPMPNDPAILNASHPGPNDGPSHFAPPGYPPHPSFGAFYPPGQFGRGYPPPPGGFGPGPGFAPYGPPPPGYFGPPGGQGFPPGPGHPFHHPQAPIAPPGQRNNAPPIAASQPPAETRAPGSAPIPPANQTSELPDNKAAESAMTGPEKTATAPAPARTKPTLAEIAAKPPHAPAASAGLDTTKNAAKPNRVMPAVPLTVNQKSFTPPVSTEGPATNGTSTKPAKPASSQAAMDEAARQAKEAVAAAMAKLNPQAAAPKSMPPASIDALSKKVQEMSTSQTTNGTGRGGRGGFRGGRGGQYPRGRGGKIEIPKSDFDFESANAKFNKEDLIKEAIATGSPPVPGSDDVGETEARDADAPAPKRKDSLPTGGSAYNKTTSFFDNISSEAKDREEGHDGRAHGRPNRGEEFKKNIETFGQGNVEGGYRGRGRGGYGRGRPYGGSYRGGYNRGGTGYRGNRGRGGQGSGQAPQSTAPTVQAPAPS